MKPVRITLLTLFFVFLAVCLALFFLPRSWQVYDPAKGTSIPIVTITIVRNYDVLHLSALSLAILFLALACVSLEIKSMPLRWGLWLFPLCLYPASCVISVASNLGPWTYHGSVQDRAGNVYWFLDSSFLQGQLMSLARLKERTWFLDKFEVLTATNGDSPRFYLHIVRPDEAQEGYGQLYLAKTNWLVGVRYENKMYLAYDLNSKKPYVQDDVLALSPFILIGNDTRLKQADCDQLLEIGIGNKAGQSDVGQPHESVITEALNSGNPEVRELAKKLLATKKPAQ
jgi:hypothetical protein